MSVPELLLASAILAVGSAVQGSLGFGSMVVAAPFLVLIDPGLIPAPALVGTTTLVGLMAWRDRHAVDRDGVGWTLAGRVPGTVAGGALVAAFSATALEVMFGSILLVAVLLSAGSLHIRRTPRLLFGAGSVSGLMGTATSVGGPPLALVYQREEGPTIRGTLSLIWVVGNALSLATLVAFGELGTTEFWRGVVLTPGVLAGFALSTRLTPILDRANLRPIVLWFAGLAAVAVLAKAAV